MKNWLLQFMVAYEQEADFQFSSFGTEFLSFIAKNQFKKGIVKYAPSETEENEQKIAIIMNPLLMVKNDCVRCQINILPKSSD